MSTPASLGSRARAFYQSPAGPKTIHFWAPTFKWGITFANIAGRLTYEVSTGCFLLSAGQLRVCCRADFQRPAENISYPQQLAVTATGLIWSRFSTQIRPKNYNLLTVNAFMAMTGIYQLSRKWAADHNHKLPASS